MLGLISANKKLASFFVGIVFLFLVLRSVEVFFIVFLMFLYVSLVSYLFSDKSIADPRVLLVQFFFVYSSFFALRLQFFEFTVVSIDKGVVLESLRLQYFAILSLVTALNIFITSGAEKNLLSQDFFSVHSQENDRAKLSELLIIALVLPVIMYVFMAILGSSALSKRDVLENLGVLDDIAGLLFTVLVVLYALRVIRHKRPLSSKFVVSMLTVGALFVLVMGQRDAIFRLGLVYLIVFFDKRNRSVFLPASCILIAAVFLVPFSQFFKSFLLSGEVDVTRTGMELVLSNEFIAAGRNLYSLVYYGVDHSYTYLLSDMARAFAPTIITPDLDIQSMTSWFNREYRIDHGFSGVSGWGFTIVGQGYVVGGYPGIAVVMSMYAAVLSIFYNMRYKNIYFYVFYILVFIASIYVIRADLANLFSQAFKISGLAVLFVYLAHSVFSKKTMVKSYEG